MAGASRDFQVFAKPGGAVCNLACQYCYYLSRDALYRPGDFFPMPDHILEAYIAQHIAASTEPVINFTWHGGEPTVLGLDYFRKITALQRRHLPPDRRISNGLQTNGTLLDEDWGRFFRDENFAVGLSLDGPREMHDVYRSTRTGGPTFDLAMNGYETLRRHQVSCDILCVVNNENVKHPLEVYRFFKRIGPEYLGFLPLVERDPAADGGVSPRSVPAAAFGDFLIKIFDEWKNRDIGRVMVQIFEETAQTALCRDHALCIFKETCGNLPVVERNGDFYSCDHFVDPDHQVGNILETPLADLLDSPAQKAFGRAKLETLTQYCRDCAFLAFCHGGCPKDRFIQAPDGQPGLSYLCEGYQRFFAHCQPFVRALGAEHRRRLEKPMKPSAPPLPPVKSGMKKVGRNDPCPCGSGLKYKKCCLGKENLNR